MNGRGPAVAEPFFMAGRAGRLFALHNPPSSATPTGEAVLFVPPFAEEMNKARRMYALMARRLSALGYGSLHVDLYGTGDSQGDFGDARWDVWLNDLRDGAEWLRAHGYRAVHVIALRLGALLALDLVQQTSFGLGRLMLWQPVTRGDAFLKQFLRLRLVASMMDSAREKESTDTLRRALRAGEAVEVAGYLLAPEMAAAIESWSFAAVNCPRTVAVHWYEISSNASRPLSPATVRSVEALEGAGLRVEAHVVKGEPFWSTIEVAVVPDLLDATSAVFAGDVTYA